MATPDYEQQREQYKPTAVKWLFVSESPPPAADSPSSRHFYRIGPPGTDWLFINVIKALYGTEDESAQIKADKDKWLQRLRADGVYQIEAIPTSMPHEATKPERQAFIEKNLPKLVEQVKSLAIADTKLILIKSNVFDIAAKPLRDAGFNVINEQLIDYPGRFSQKAFQAKLPPLMAAHGWSS